MHTLDVYTVGGIDFLIQVFRAIVLILGDNTWKTMIMITFVYAAFIAFLIGLRKNTYPIWWIVATFFAFHLMFTAKININLIDTKLGKNYVIQGVPFGIGLTTSILSSVSKFFTDMIDATFHTGITYIYGGQTKNSYPQALDFSTNNYAGVYEYFDRLRKLNIDKYLSPDKREIINTYFTQCLFLDMASWSSNDIAKLQFSPDVINQDLLRVKNNLLMSYKGQTFYCINFYDNYAKKALTDFVKLISNNTSLLAIMRDKAALKQSMSSVVNAFTGGNQNFAQIVGNAAVREALKNAYIDVASSSQTLSQDVILGYMKGEAEGRLMLLAKSFFMASAEWIPMLNNVLQFVLIGIMPLMAAVILIPGMLSLLKKFFITTTWVYLWLPVFALVDGIHKTAAIAQAQNYVSTLYSTLPFGIGTGWNTSVALSIASAGNLYEITDDMKALAGFLSFFVPGIAWMVLTASDHVISGFGSRIASQMGSVSTPETITRAITAETIGMKLSDGEIGHGLAVRQAVWGNAYSMAQSYATNKFGTGNVKDIYKSSMYNTAKNTGLGSNMYDMFDGDTDNIKSWGASSAPKELMEGLTVNGKISSAIQRTADEAYSKTVSKAMNDVWQAGEKYTESKQFSDSIMYATSKAWGKSDSYITSKYSKYSDVIETFKGVENSISKSFGFSDKESAAVANELFAEGGINSSLLKKASLGDKKALNMLRNIFSKAGVKLGDRVSDKNLQEWAKTVEAKYGSSISSGDTFKKLVQMENDFKHDEQAKKELNYAVKGEEGTKINWNEDLSWAQNVSNTISKVQTVQQKLSELKSNAANYEMQYGHRLLKFVADEYYKGNLSLAKASINYATPEQMDMWVSDFMQRELGVDFDGNVDVQKLESENKKFSNETKNYKFAEDRDNLRNTQFKKMGDKFIQDHEKGTDKWKGQEGVKVGQAKHAVQGKFKNLKKEYNEQTGAAQTEIDGGKNYIEGKGKEVETGADKTRDNVKGQIGLNFGQRVSRMNKEYGWYLKALGALGIANTGLDLWDEYRRGHGNSPHTPTTVEGKPKGKGTIHGGKTPPGLEIPHKDVPAERTWKGKSISALKTAAGFTAFGLPAAYFANEAEKEGKEVITTGYTDPSAYAGQKILGLLHDGYEYVKEFLGGDSKPQTVRTFQGNIYKPIDLNKR